MKNNLIPKKTTVTRDGKSFVTTVFINPDKDAKKHDKISVLHKKYETILKKVNTDIKPSMDKKSRAALGTKMIMLLGLRIGNTESAEGILHEKKGEVLQTYGLSTLKKEHVKFEGKSAILSFLGKKGVAQTIKVIQPTLVQQIRQAHAKSKGDTLLNTSKYHVAEYIRQNIGTEYTPKDMRGLKANIEAARMAEKLSKKPKVTEKDAKKEIQLIAAHVSKILGNTIGAAKRAYIDPVILNNHLRNRTKKK